jgi:hypothetical protein
MTLNIKFDKVHAEYLKTKYLVSEQYVSDVGFDLYLPYDVIIEPYETKFINLQISIEYIKNGYHPEILIKSLLSNETMLRDYGKCIEHSGSSWAFLSSALYKVGATTNNQEE